MTDQPSRTRTERLRAAALWLRDSALGGLGYAIVLTVATAGWAASFIGLHQFGVEHMHLSNNTAWLVPLTFDGAPAGLSIVVMRASTNGRTALVWRLLVVGFTGLSSWINYMHITDPTGRWVAAFMPPSAVILFEGLMSEARAAAVRRLRELGELSAARPRLHPLRWFFDRAGTLDLYRRYVLGLPLPGELTEAGKPQHVICAGPTGLLFLRRPMPLKYTAPAAPAGVVGTRIENAASLFGYAHASVVYFITNGSRVKIGTTQNLRKRVSTLCLRVDDIALVLHGDQTYERSLHERFAEHRAGDTEWFALAGDLAAFVAAGGDRTALAPVAESAPETPAPVASPAPTTGDSEAVSERQEKLDAGDSKAASSAPNGRQRTPRASAGGKRTARRSMTEWVDLAAPVFHAEFERLRRQPTGDEFAEAIKKARLGTVSASTAKNIRAEILDRAELPVLD